MGSLFLAPSASAATLLYPASLPVLIITFSPSAFPSFLPYRLFYDLPLKLELSVSHVRFKIVSHNSRACTLTTDTYYNIYHFAHGFALVVQLVSGGVARFFNVCTMYILRNECTRVSTVPTTSTPESWPRFQSRGRGSIPFG